LEAEALALGDSGTPRCGRGTLTERVFLDLVEPPLLESRLGRFVRLDCHLRLAPLAGDHRAEAVDRLDQRVPRRQGATKGGVRRTTASTSATATRIRTERFAIRSEKVAQVADGGMCLDARSRDGVRLRHGG
jgi:hypothetical protein